MRLGRELAERLAGQAERTAAILELLADLHDRMAASGHPLAEAATARAVAERATAAQELQASAWFRSLARGPGG